MGNCNKKDENLTITSYEDDRWEMFPSSMHPSCAIMQNIYYPNLRLMKWLGPLCPKSDSPLWPEIGQTTHLPTIYEIGYTRKFEGDIFDEPGLTNKGQSKKQYLITEQLIRVKDMNLTEEEVIVVLHQAIAGYQALLIRFEGFVAREDMIFIDRDGLVKVWMHENLAESQPQFPHPYISQEQFLSSLIRQICCGVEKKQSLMAYLLSQEMNFQRIWECLNGLIHMRRSKLRIDVEKGIFDQIFKTYKIEDKEQFKRSRARGSATWNGRMSMIDKRNSNQLQFIVGQELNPNKKIAYVRDYSMVNFAFNKDRRTDRGQELQLRNLQKIRSNRNLIEVQSKLIVEGGKL